MQLVDLLFLVVIVLSAWSGWRSGFIYAAIGLILWVGSLAAAFCLYPDLVRPLVHLAPGLGVWTLPAAFLLALLLARLLLWLFFSRLLAMLPPDTEELRRSQLADDLTLPAEWVEERLSPVFEQPVERTIARLSIAHTGLMHSPGHRANILNPAFHRVGIGIIEGGVHGLMISQEFRN
jgi:hypothetical protein